MQYQIGPPPMNPLTRLLAGVVGVLALAGALFFGFFVLLLALGAGLVAWLFIWLRMWWLRKKFMAGEADFPDEQPRPGPGRPEENGDVIDAEYTVVSRQDEE